MKRPIYMDYSSTTPVDPAVTQVMLACLEKEGVFGNPASQTHRYGWEADQCIRQAQQQVATLIHADPREIVWTSGATEANNLAIKGAAYFYRRKGRHIITMSTEHKAVLDPCAYLESNGFEVTYLSPQPNGLLDLAQLEAALRPDTVLVSIMHLNNETGVVQDIAAIAQLVHEAGALFHSDAAQSAGKLPIDVRAMQVDLLSLSGHKVYGPKGVGVLFVSRSPRIRLEPQMHGGGHQHGLRSGTLATHQIVGMGEAFRIAHEQLSSEQQRLIALCNRLWQGIAVLPHVHLNRGSDRFSCACLNISVEDIDSEMLLTALSDLAISSGSACNAAHSEPSHVLRAMGLSRVAAQRSIRISLGRFTTEAEVDYAIQYIVRQLRQLRQTAAEG